MRCRIRTVVEKRTTSSCASFSQRSVSISPFPQPTRRGTAGDNTHRPWAFDAHAVCFCAARPRAPRCSVARFASGATAPFFCFFSCVILLSPSPLLPPHATRALWTRTTQEFSFPCATTAPRSRLLSLPLAPVTQRHAGRTAPVLASSVSASCNASPPCCFFSRQSSVALYRGRVLGCPHKGRERRLCVATAGSPAPKVPRTRPFARLELCCGNHVWRWSS